MGKRVGVVGGGQLAWMMADAAKRLAVDLVVQTPSQDDPAVAIASDVILAAVDDAQATAKLAQQCDVITFENEFIDLAALRPLAAEGIRFYPQINALAPLLDKYQQRCYLRDLGLPVPQFVALDEANPFLLSQFTFPIVLKARRHGYDGQGTYIVKDLEALEALLRRRPRFWLLEAFVPFERELAIMVARSVDGTISLYPVVETQQENQVCRRVLVTQDLDAMVVEQVEAIARTLMSRLQVVGIFGIELFLTAEGKVLVNEIAPRTHNSGHYSLDACVTSQFEQHLRMVCGLPPGDPTLQWDAAVMVNLLGYEYSQDDYFAKQQQLAALPQTHLHWYGKSISRPGRKLGHVTCLIQADSPEAGRSQAIALAQQIESIWYP